MTVSKYKIAWCFESHLIHNTILRGPARENFCAVDASETVVGVVLRNEVEPISSTWTGPKS